LWADFDAKDQRIEEQSGRIDALEARVDAIENQVGTATPADD
jgi:polyhydroxyalkanoate synthesis regulator phasin